MSTQAKTEITPQIPDGWARKTYPHTFSSHAGPFYFADDAAASGVGFFSQPHHGNLGGVVHGGMLMTLADMALFDAFFRNIAREPAVTVSMNSEFLSGGPIGKFIEAHGEVTKAGRSLVFVRGMISAEGANLMAFSGTIKRVKPPAPVS